MTKVIQIDPLLDISEHYESIQQDNIAFQSTVDDLQLQIVSYKKTIDSLNAKVAELNAQIVALTTTAPPPVVNPPANVEGLTVYDWSGCNNIPQISWPDNMDIPGSNGWRTNVETGNNAMISIVSDVIRKPGSKSILLKVNPYNPTPNPARVANFRAEIYKTPWHEQIPLKTEEWHSWSYFFPVPITDPTNECTIHQLHASEGSPAIDMWLSNGTGHQHINVTINGTSKSGRYIVYNMAAPNINADNSIIPPTGVWIDFVEHVIWDTDAGGEGLYELWLQVDKKGYNKFAPTYKGGTVYASAPYGGTFKLGIYKHPWCASTVPANATPTDAAKALVAVNAVKDAIATDAAVGIKELAVYVGPTTILRRAKGKWIGAAGLDLVKP